MQKLVLWIGGVLVAGIAGVGAVLLVREDPSDASRPASVVQTGGADIGGAFELTTHEGARVTAGEVIDGPTLVYFGYTFCPDVCPVDTYNMAAATELLEERGVEVTPVFVTVDPARDDREALSHWVDSMHPRMVGLTGTPEEIETAAEAYKVYYERVEAPDSAVEYLMNHTSYTYFMMPDGLAALFRHGATPEEIAAEVTRVLEDRGALG